MESSSTDRHYNIPPALPSILKGFARETLRSQVSHVSAATYETYQQPVRAFGDSGYEFPLIQSLQCDLQPQDIYKFAAHYFKELHQKSSMQTQPELPGSATANMQANLLRMLLC